MIFEAADDDFIPSRRRESEIFEVSKLPFRPYLSLELSGLSDTP